MSLRLLGLVFLAGGTLTPVSAASFQAGAAKVDITPPSALLPIRTAGNLTRTVVSNIHDALHARALVLDDGTNRLALATVDSCMVAREDLDRAKSLASRATGIPVSHMLVSATHTHTAPAVYGCHGNDPEPAYLEFLVPRIAEAITLAWQRRQAARVGWASQDLPTFVHCRRWLMQPGTALHPNPAFTGCPTNAVMMNPGAANTNKLRQTGPVDPAVTVLAVQTAAGRPLSVVANYSTHYANAPSSALSADYFGEFSERMGAGLGVDAGDTSFVAMISNGTSGDANCIDFTRTNWTVTPPLVAQAVVAAATVALERIRYVGWAPLAAVETPLELAVRKPSASQLAEARAYLAAQVGDRPTRTWEENYARETTLLAGWPERKELLLQALRIGDLGIAAIPCEVYGSTGLGVKLRSPFPTTLVVGLANGYHGYLPPPEQFPLGGYTTWRARSSYLETNAEPLIARSMDALLTRLRVPGPGASGGPPASGGRP